MVACKRGRVLSWLDKMPVEDVYGQYIGHAEPLSWEKKRIVFHLFNVVFRESLNLSLIFSANPCSRLRVASASNYPDAAYCFDCGSTDYHPAFLSHFEMIS